MTDILEETYFIGKTWFIGDNASPADMIKPEGKVLIVNFPGSGMCCSSEDKEITSQEIAAALETNQKTKKLILDGDSQFKLDDCIFYTAVYQNKADKAIKEYNSDKGRKNTEDTEAIFAQVLLPMISEDYTQTLSNLNKLIFRGHCFGAMVISELEVLLEKELQQRRFNQDQIDNLLSAPKALISSPALQIKKYPKRFQTTAIVNISDRTLTNEQYCGIKLKNDLCELADFQPEDLVSFDPRAINEAYKAFCKSNGKGKVFSDPLTDLPEIRSKEVILHNLPDSKENNRKNVHLYICNRADLAADNYKELKESIENRMAETGMTLIDEKAYLKKLKKNLGGHEFYFLPDELQKYFADNFRKSVSLARKSAELASERYTDANLRKVKDLRKRLKEGNQFKQEVVSGDLEKTRLSKNDIGKVGTEQGRYAAQVQLGTTREIMSKNRTQR